MSLRVRGRVLRALLALPLLASRLRPRVGLRHREPGSPRHGLRRRLRGAGRRPLRHLLQRRRHRLPEGQAALRRRRLLDALDGLHRVGALPGRGHDREVEQRAGRPALLLLLAAGGREGGDRHRREPAVRAAARSGTTPTPTPGATSACECKISSWSINPTIAYKVADRLSIGAGLDVRLSNFSLSRRLSREPQPLPRADGRRGADPRQRDRHRGRLQPRPPREPDREPVVRALVPPRGLDRPRRAGRTSCRS